MKKIYITLLSGLFINQLSAQTLTQAAHEPVSGDMNSYKGYDSSGVVPKNTGAGMSWNFSSFTINTTTTSSTFTTATSVPAATNFPGATTAEDQGSGNYNFYKTVGSSYESLGSSSPSGDFTYTNSAVAVVWPATMGYSLTDAFSGTVTGGFSGTLAGTVTTQGTGTGTITLPGGLVMTNILQVRVKNNVNLNITTPFPLTATVTGVDYMYYHSSQKFPVLRVSYSATTGFTNTSSATIELNSAIITGLTDKNFDATFQIFPNPAKDAFNVRLTNTENSNGTIEVFNSIGQLVKVINLGNSPVIQHSVSLTDLNSGIYIVKTTLGNKVSSRKLIVE
ncbi:MAG: hypothetical protein JWO32_2504 [Bacteroidetes bacterium]|nr:hypothetical protein [Bacteroidota bacterium]